MTVTICRAVAHDASFSQDGINVMRHLNKRRRAKTRGGSMRMLMMLWGSVPISGVLKGRMTTLRASKAW
jgi:hypothetical protein